MEDSIPKRVYLEATVFAFVAFTTSDTVVAGICNTTLSTGWESTVSTTEHIVQTGIIIWEPFVEVLYGELHTTSVLQRLHVVKG